MLKSAATAGTKRVVLVRHGESEYNSEMRAALNWVNPFFYARGCDPCVQDPVLT